jgi:hypothetical protein
MPASGSATLDLDRKRRRRRRRPSATDCSACSPGRSGTLVSYYLVRRAPHRPHASSACAVGPLRGCADVTSRAIGHCPRRRAASTRSQAVPSSGHTSRSGARGSMINDLALSWVDTQQAARAYRCHFYLAIEWFMGPPGTPDARSASSLPRTATQCSWTRSSMRASCSSAARRLRRGALHVGGVGERAGRQRPPGKGPMDSVGSAPSRHVDPWLIWLDGRSKAQAD